MDVQLVARLDNNRHAYIFAFLKCPQFIEPKSTVFLVDTGCTITTVLSDDVTRLSINCNDLQRSSVSVSTANDNIHPYELREVDLIFRVKYGWLNQKNGLAQVHLNKIHCMPPNHLHTPTHDSEMANTLLGMDVLHLFKKWKYEDTSLKLET